MTKVPKETLKKVDRYITLYSYYKRIEKEMKELRTDLTEYMEDTGLTSIQGSEGKKVSLVETDMAYISANYTSYNAEDVMPHLTPSARKKCIVRVVDRDALEALMTLGEVPETVKTLKRKKPITNFVVK